MFFQKFQQSRFFGRKAGIFRFFGENLAILLISPLLFLLGADRKLIFRRYISKKKTIFCSLHPTYEVVKVFHNLTSNFDFKPYEYDYPIFIRISLYDNIPRKALLVCINLLKMLFHNFKFFLLIHKTLS